MAKSVGRLMYLLLASVSGWNYRPYPYGEARISLSKQERQELKKALAQVGDVKSISFHTTGPEAGMADVTIQPTDPEYKDNQRQLHEALTKAVTSVFAGGKVLRLRYDRQGLFKLIVDTGRSQDWPVDDRAVEYLARMVANEKKYRADLTTPEALSLVTEFIRCQDKLDLKCSPEQVKEIVERADCLYEQEQRDIENQKRLVSITIARRDDGLWEIGLRPKYPYLYGSEDIPETTVVLDTKDAAQFVREKLTALSGSVVKTLVTYNQLLEEALDALVLQANQTNT